MESLAGKTGQDSMWQIKRFSLSMKMLGALRYTLDITFWHMENSKGWKLSGLRGFGCHNLYCILYILYLTYLLCVKLYLFDITIGMLQHALCIQASTQGGVGYWSAANPLKSKLKKKKIRLSGIKRFMWFTLQPKSAVEIGWWLVH
jgi:hypothetical protein